MVQLPSLDMEKKYWLENRDFIFGVDEAGRGCLAGPVYAAVVAWPKNILPTDIPPGIRDSKKLSAGEREQLFTLITEQAALFGIGSATNEEIDRWNILQATSLAVARAVKSAWEKMQFSTPASPTAPSIAYLSDGSNSLVERARFFIFHPQFREEFLLLQEAFRKPITEDCLVKGDDRSVSIAAASILAKVTRDVYMENIHESFPHYNFKTHKGYGTLDHREAIVKHGPCSIHRYTFAPIRDRDNPELPRFTNL